MPNAGIALVAGCLCAVVLFARLRVSFATVVAACVLFPGTLPIVNPITTYAYFGRTVVLAFGLRLLLDRRAGRLDREAFRWTPVHTAFVAFLTIVYATGVVLAGPAADADRMTNGALNLAEQFLFFVVVLAAARAVADIRWLLGAVSVVLLASCGLAIVEHATGWSWGHWLFQDQTLRTDAANELERRVGQVRVRAGAEYALQFAWVTAMLLPLLLAWLGGFGGRLRRWLPLTLGSLAVVLLAEYWAYSRTALAALGGLTLVTAAAARHRRLLAVTLTGVAAGVTAFLVSGTLQQGYLDLPSGYASIRTYRLPNILAAAVEHPLHGLGLNSLAGLGFQSTDTSYLQLYADAGLVSLAALAVLLIVALAACLRGLWAEDAPTRLAAAAAVAGCLAMIVGGFAYDALRSLSSSRVFWLVVVIGVVATERVTGPLPGFARWRWRTVGAAAGVAAAAGLVAMLVTPVHYAQLYEFSTIGAARETEPVDPVTPGETLINTVCGVATVVDAAQPGTLSCRDLKQAAGVGELRVQAGSPPLVSTVTDEVREHVVAAGINTFGIAAKTPVKSGRPTALQWAPVWLPVVVVLLMLLLPPLAARRSPYG
jgi:hypothetical protein